MEKRALVVNQRHPKKDILHFVYFGLIESELLLSSLPTIYLLLSAYLINCNQPFGPSHQTKSKFFILSFAGICLSILLAAGYCS